MWVPARVPEPLGLNMEEVFPVTREKQAQGRSRLRGEAGSGETQAQGSEEGDTNKSFFPHYFPDH